MAAFPNTSDASFINENELIAQASMIVEWAGNSVGEELIHGVDIMGALLWLSQGHVCQGVAARIQVEGFLLACYSSYSYLPFLHPFSLQYSHRFPHSYTKSEITQRTHLHLMKRVRLGTRRSMFVKLTTPLHDYPNLQPKAPVCYRNLSQLKANFAEFNPMIFPLCRFVAGVGLIPNVSTLTVVL